jgi:predicted nucleic acid-binding protein
MSETPAVVIDASLAIHYVTATPWSAAATRAMHRFEAQRARLLAPGQWLYEVTSVVRRMIFDGYPRGAGEEGLRELLNLGVELIDDEDLCFEALRWAEKLKIRSAYDAFYLALCAASGAELWTLDRRLAENARQIGFERVFWAGELAGGETASEKNAS